MTSDIPPPGHHGDDAARVAAVLATDPAEVLDLAQSMNPVAPSAAHVVGRHLTALDTYPDPTRAETALAEAMGVERELLLLTNGGAEAIALVAADCRTGHVEQPEFSLYTRHLETLDPSAGRWRSNPNNPTGLLAHLDQRAAVWDEAFFPLSTGTWTRGDHRSGSVVVGSLTKLLACPGLRIGYVIAAERAVRDRLAARQARWSVNGLAAAALPELLEPVDLQGWCSDIAKLRGELVELLQSHGLSVQPSDAPYVLVSGVDDLRERLAREQVVVRDCASFGLSGSFRIAVPDGDGLERLDGALGRALERRSDGAAPRLRGRKGVRADRGDASPVRAAGDSDWTELRGALMVCGTSSDAGKSQIVAGICRALSRRGVSVAPFKGQNMSLNSFVTPAGHEIGRAQGMQAMAARAVPEVSMNPVLLKPTGERRSQVVVMGRPVAELDAREYQHAKRDLRPTVLAALSDLRARFDVVILEGAGSPAEINLLEGDLVNLGLAAEAGVPAIILGDIERGGVFASLYGTVALLPERLRRCLRGFAVNKLRGDPSLLDTGIAELERRTGLPSLGVIPWVDGLMLDAEDSLALRRSWAGTYDPSDEESSRPTVAPGGNLDIAVVRLPRIANFTDLDALALEPAVAIRFVSSPAQLGSPDLIIIPGSKTTVADLAWLRESGLASALGAAVEAPDGPVVLGVCAGYQMLGEWIEDGVESRAGLVTGLGMLAVGTRFEKDKVTLPRRGMAFGAGVTGYEIRHGRPLVADGSEWIELARVGADGAEPAEDSEEPEGASGRDGRVIGTSLHGLFESDAFRAAFLSRIAERVGKAFSPSGVSFALAREAQFERVADLVEKYLDLDSLWRIIAGAQPEGASL